MLSNLKAIRGAIKSDIDFLLDLEIMVIPRSIISGEVVSGDIIRPDLYVQIWALPIQVRHVKTQQRCHKFATASAEDIGSGLFQTSSFFAVFHDGPWMT